MLRTKMRTSSSVSLANGSTNRGRSRGTRSEFRGRTRCSGKNAVLSTLKELQLIGGGLRQRGDGSNSFRGCFQIRFAKSQVFEQTRRFLILSCREVLSECRDFKSQEELVVAVAFALPGLSFSNQCSRSATTDAPFCAKRPAEQALASNLETPSISFFILFSPCWRSFI